jgi:hypothetical protein
MVKSLQKSRSLLQFVNRMITQCSSKKMKEIVPEFKSKNSRYETLDLMQDQNSTNTNDELLLEGRTFEQV